MKPELLLFTDHFPFGNTEPFLIDELPYLLTQFHYIKIIPLDTAKDSRQRSVPEGVEVVEPGIKNFKSKRGLIVRGFLGKGDLRILLKDLIESRAWLNPGKLLHWFTVSLLIRAYLPLFIDLVKQIEHPEKTLLYFYWGQRWSQIIPFIDPVFSKIVIRFHGSDLYEELYHGYIPFREKQLKRLSGVFTISSFGKEYLLKRYPSYTQKVFISRLGTRDHGLNPEQKILMDSYTLVSCASVSKTKRIILIPEILRHIDLPVHWIHLGDGPEMHRVRSTCKNLPKNITFTLKGQVTQEELFHFYATHPVNLFINVSSSEGIPVSIMEAFSFGIPVMATDVGGTGELVNSTNGRLVPKDFSPAETARLLGSILQSRNLPEMRKAARKMWEAHADSNIVYPEFVSKLVACSSTSVNR